MKITLRENAFDFKEGDVIECENHYYLIVKEGVHYHLLSLDTFSIGLASNTSIRNLLTYEFGKDRKIVKINSELILY